MPCLQWQLHLENLHYPDRGQRQRHATVRLKRVNTNCRPTSATSLSYDATHAYLNLILNFSIPGSLNGNQQAVGNALTYYFNNRRHSR